MAAFVDRPFPLNPRGTVSTRISLTSKPGRRTRDTTTSSTLAVPSQQESIAIAAIGPPTQSTYDFIPTNSLPAGAHTNGPFIDAAQFTNFPTMNYLNSIHIPSFARLNIVEEFKRLSNTATHHVSRTPAEEWGYYLRSSILKHFSHNKYCTPLKAGPHRMEHRAAYSKFMREFLDSVTCTNDMQSQTDEKKAELVHLEQDLTQKTFRCYPILFHNSLHANETLIQHLQAAAAAVSSNDNVPASIDALRDKLWRDWIDLSDALDLTNGLDPIYDTHTDLQARYYTLLADMEIRLHAAPDDDDDDEEADYEHLDADGHFRIFEDPTATDARAGDGRVGYDTALLPLDRQARMVRLWWWRERAGGVENMAPRARVRRRRHALDVEIQILGIGHGWPRWTAVYR